MTLNAAFEKLFFCAFKKLTIKKVTRIVIFVFIIKWFNVIWHKRIDKKKWLVIESIQNDE